VGPIPGLASTYETEWVGPWLGLDLIVPMNEKITLSAGFEYHWTSYKAEANWNLRSDLAHPKSFEHSADGTGFELSLGGRYAFSDRWSLALTTNYQKWSTDPGVDRVYLVNGAISAMRLNEVAWESFAILIGITYRFQIEFANSI
jgi:long-subunit fatty acid transport protein